MNHNASRKFVDLDAPVTLAIASLSATEPEPEAEPVAMSGCGWVALIVGVLVLLGVVGAIFIANARDTGPGGGPDFGMKLPQAADDDANHATARADVMMLGQAVERFRLRMDSAGMESSLPATLQELVTGPADWEGEWHSLLSDLDVPLDPWGNEYHYAILDEEAGEFVVICYGRDGMPGGEGSAADIRYPR